MEDRFVMFRNRLTKAYRHLSRQARKSSVSCYRIYDHDLPEFPFCIELYEKKLYVAEYLRRHGMNETQHEQWLDNCTRVIADVLSIPVTDIFLKLRKRKAGRQDQYRRQHHEQAEFIVGEGGLKFIVNLSDYLDTGLFLDHRITRQLVREESAGKKVLNLFAYTGSFSVYAASGGASSVETVDLSKTYIAWAKRNLELNGFNDERRYLFHQADVLQWLEKIPGSYYDLIILDPPTFSNSKKMDSFLDIQKDHVRLINQCLQGLGEGGKLYFSTNYTQFEMDSKRIACSGVKEITKSTTPFDFERNLQRRCFVISK